MPDLAANSVLAGNGNSGDSVRVVTDAALLLSSKSPGEALDETFFWRKEGHDLSEQDELSTDGVMH